MRRILLAVTLVAGLIGMAQAAIEANSFKSEAERERFRALTEELRCPKCQNQNIADSEAAIAKDLRREILRMMDEDKSNEEIVDFLVMRYGDFVRYKPPVDGRTYLLWYGPFVLLGCGALVLGVLVARRRRSAKAPQASVLSADERARLDALLKNQDPQDP